MKFKFFVFVIVLSLVLSACSSDSNDEKKSSSKQNTETPGMIKKAPEGLDFYKTPTEIEFKEPGEIIYSQALSGLSSNVNGWKVLYTTTALNGSLVPASAIIYSPRNSEKHDIVVWAHGTVGMADACAPSRLKDPSKSIPYFKDYIDKGHVVVAPDYEGLGTEGVHPFLVGQSEGRSILDSIRMAKKFYPINPKNESVVVGHSQGGQASLFAGELNNTYAPDVKLKGVVGLAPAGELRELISAASTNNFATGLVVMGAVGFSKTYKDIDLSTVLTPDAIAKSSIVEQGCLIVVTASLSNAGIDLLADPSTLEPWKTYLDENSPGRIKSLVPVFIAHGERDTTVEPEISATMFDKACAVGSKVYRKTYSGKGSDHSGIKDAAKSDVLKFVADRFADKEFRSNCDS